jgi:molybdopterin molybdotransferase
VLPSGKVILTEPPFKANFSPKGEDVRAGDAVLRKGKIIKPQDVAVLASVGCTTVKVAGKPLVAIISTGDELVEPDIKPGIASIRNSNAYQLMAQAERTGALARYYGIAPDDEDATLSLINSAVSENSIVILTGGVSMGDYDFVPSVLSGAGVKILFDQVNVQPGKPTTFGVHKNCIVFGLPGNPVSAFIQFETLVRPFIYGCMGHDWKPFEVKLPMARKFERKAAGRAAWIPVIITDGSEVMPAEYHGSAHLTAFPYADGIIPVEAGKSVIEKGEIVSVRQI